MADGGKVLRVGGDALDEGAVAGGGVERGGAGVDGCRR
jgi:hypothetical protein